MPASDRSALQGAATVDGACGRRPRPSRRALLLGLALPLALGLAACERQAAPGDPPLDVAGQFAAETLESGGEQIFWATVTRDGLPVRGAIVTINVFLPAGGVRWYIGAPTNAEGRTFIRFRPVQTGFYFVEVTAQANGDVITTNGGFRVELPRGD